ncbi:MAG: right-handed parallel beta-helix repeat-containing protein [Phycisphaerales bacterium]|nr:right-handed parallel beta-helix repeat-containing protein [Planctomycetota bacterium]MCH8509746.1 right-handed parallel beta-helix repeat-containing protein [Phycisphaerales bacterium]
MDHASQTDTANPTDPATHRRAMLAGIGGLAAGALLAGKASAGPLNPPLGPIAPTPGPEPRIAINSTNTPGSSNSNFIITQPGSYYLTGNISGVSGRNGLAINADNVTVDLMGYALVGVPGSLNGITATASRKNIQIRNGVTAGWGSMGVSALSSNTRISDIIAADNASSGIRIGLRGAVTNSTASNNAQRGIFGDFNCSVSGCNCSNNGTDGIVLGAGASVLDSVAGNNIARGIAVNADSTVISCIARSNGSRGIETSWASIVSHCTVISNGEFGIFTLNGDCSITDCTVRSNGEGGIRVFQRSIVRGNNCSGNGSSGAPGILMSSSRNRIDSNHCTGNAVGIRSTASANLIFANTCNGNGTNLDIAPSNYCWAPSIITTAAINGVAGGGFSPFGSNTPDPLANFSY